MQIGGNKTKWIAFKARCRRGATSKFNGVFLRPTFAFLAVLSVFLVPPVVFYAIEKLTQTVSSGIFGYLLWNTVRIGFTAVAPLILLFIYRRNKGLLLEAREPAPNESRTTALALLSIGGAIALWLVHHKVIFDLNSRYFTSIDAHQFLGLGLSVGRQIGLSTPMPWNIDAVAAPAGLNALLVDGYGPIWLLGLATKALNPVLAYNLILCFATLANYIAGTRLARELGARAASAALVGLAVATAPSLVIRYHGHLNLIWIALPILVAVQALRRRRNAHSTTKIILLLVAALLTSGYLFLIAFIAYFLVLLDHKKSPWQKVVRSHLSILIVVSLAVIPLVAMRLSSNSHDGEIARQVESAIEDLTDASRLIYAADMGAVIVDHPFHEISISRSLNVLEKSSPKHFEGWSSPGLILIIGFALAICLIPSVATKALTAYLLIGLLMWSPLPRFNDHYFLLGGIDGTHLSWLPTGLFNHLPILDAIRIPGRFSLLLIVLFAGLLAQALVDIEHKRSTRTISLTLLALLTLLIATNTLEIPTGEILFADDFVEEVAALNQPGQSIVMVPNDCNGTEVQYALLAGLSGVNVEGCTAPHLSAPLVALATRYKQSKELQALSCNPQTFGRYASVDSSSGQELASILINLTDNWEVAGVVIDRTALQRTGCSGLATLVNPLVASSTQRFVLVDLAHFAESR